jgi:lysophospholipase L1-like esterase
MGMNVDFRMILVGFLLVLLLLSVGISCKLIKQNRHLTRDLARIRLTPLGLEHFDGLSLPESEKNMDSTTVLFFGDSRAAAWPTPEMDDSFTFVNRGIGGQSSAQAVLRFDAHVVPVQPDVVVVQVCVNDLRRIPVFPQEKEDIIQACQKNIKRIVEQSRSLKAVVLLTTIFPVQDPSLTEHMFWSDEVYDGIALVNAYIRSLEGDDVQVLDGYELLADENGRLRSQYAADYLHINEAGYHLLNKVLIDILTSTTAP